ncbi:MAG: DUF302 domain-containing protein [Thiohalobacteraceae bacterium]|nr:DUF302 domain-containing protein [Gammaproteobacteria bacterium]
MNAIRNVFSLIGLLAVVATVYVASVYRDDIAAVRALDPGAAQMYAEMWSRIKETGTSADATAWRIPLAEGVAPADAEQVMKFVANQHNISGVGELPLSEQVELMTGEKQRFLKIYEYCDPRTAMQMVDYSDAFSAYLPCRIALVEDKDGHYALYSLNMDLMISGGRPLPPDLKKEALRVKQIIRDIMERGATGELF